MRFLPVLCLSISTPMLMLPARAQQSPPVVPAEPPVLFAALPGGDATWKLAESRAKSDYNSDWVQTVVTRSWEGAVATDGANPRVQITLIDTGGFPAFNGMFLAQENPNRTKLAGFPAVIYPAAAAGVESACANVAGRFLLRIKTQHLPRGAMEDWLRKVKTSDLEALAARGGIEKLPNPLPMFVVDEIHPNRNRSWKMAWTDAETLRKANEAAAE